MTSIEKIKQLSDIIDAQLVPVINKNGKAKKCIYLDLPYHTNIGDTLIWRGIEHFLKRTGLKCLYQTSYRTYSRQKMESITKREDKAQKNVIFLHGGGNFGDLWEAHQIFRKEIIRNNPYNQIIVLPQTVFYHDKNKMKADAEIFARHKNLTICARDKKSHDILKENFQNDILLVPDMAFCIPQKELRKHALPVIPQSVLLFKRTDKELDSSVDYSQYISEKHFKTHDWITIEKEYREAYLLNKFITNRKIPNFFADLYAQNVFKKTMIKEGVRQISIYENIYTTRLHVAILSILLGKPFVFFDNSYGKNSFFFETWLDDLRDVSFIRADKPAKVGADAMRRDVFP